MYRIHQEQRTGERVKVESASRPGLFHFVDLERSFCSCEATVEICRHIRVARIRRAKNRFAIDPALAAKRAEVAKRGPYRPDTSRNEMIAACLDRMSNG